MPIVKRSEAQYDSGTPVSLAVFGSASGQRPNASHSATGSADATAQDSRVEIIRSANGEITKINVRCDCGKVASFYCDYES